MQDNLVSIFEFGKTVKKFWQECEKSVLDRQEFLVEHEFVTATKANIKPIFIVLGDTHIYKVTQDKLKCAPLQTMHLQQIDLDSDHFVQLNSEERQYGFKLSYQSQFIDIFTSNKLIYDQWKQYLRKRCLLSNFHDAYMVQKLIGKGSFAKVYLATRKENNYQYAIKAFSKSYMQQQHKGIESLVNEMFIMRKVQHPHTLQLHEVHETQNSVYFVIDIIKGGELLQRVRDQGFLSSDNLQRLSYNFLGALSHLHSMRIVHRDLKPENLLFRSADNNQDIVIADFGLAAHLDQELLFKRCGTPGFVAPEILEYNEGMELYNQKCDVFSAGVILYLLITGSQPFSGKDQKAILKANRECNINFDDTLFKSAPILLQDLVKCMLVKKQQNRLSSAECLKHAYFKELAKETQPITTQYQQKLEEYNHTFKVALKNGSMDFSLEQREALLNGNLNTLESISQASNLSFSRIELKGVITGASKFSQYSMRVLQSASKREIGDTPISKTESRRQIDLHRLAIQNNIQSQHRKNLTQFDMAIEKEVDRGYNSTRQIRVPDLIPQQKQATTPTGRSAKQN